jgi:hypothetical protein
VFKFLKDTRNLEGFRIQDFESIKKIIAMTFFAGAYMYMNKTHSLENPILKEKIEQICLLGRGKGNIGLKYLSQGLDRLFSSFLVDRWKEDNNITEEDLDEIARYFGLDRFGKSVKV